MEIKKMEKLHLDQIVELEKICFSDPWSKPMLEPELTNPLSLWFVATEGEQVLGYIGSQSVLDTADMMNIAVHPQHRRKGIAERLIASLSSELEEKNVLYLALEVRASNLPAISLYEKLGFCQVGRRPGYYRNPKEDAIIMGKELSSCEYWQ